MPGSKVAQLLGDAGVVLSLLAQVVRNDVGAHIPLPGCVASRTYHSPAQRGFFISGARMSTFRILDQAPQYLLPDGKVNAGGSITFYETDLTTPKLTWSDPEQTTPNPNPLPLDAAGRTQYDVWGEGEYGAVMRDAAGVTIWTRNNVRVAGDANQEIPALVAGQFLTNDGSNLQWAPVREVPDPTGSNGQVL